MEERRMKPLSTILCFFLGFLVILSSPARALNLGLQSVNPGGYSVSQQECSRTCESDYCTAPPFLRYGKYCGLLYSGCPGEKPCDALDACCMAHDICVDQIGYLSTECSENLLICMAKIREGIPTFVTNQCVVREVIDVVSLVIKAAVLAGRALHKP
ncbi:hypothetical protein LUZ60_006293 [Juncus effusus]|nr:hypothetical protein LUZ60_006293 [Juncus effusus]